MNRRQFLQHCATASAGVFLSHAIPSVAAVDTRDFWTRDRVIWLRRQSTGEQYRVVYWSQGQIDPDNYVRLCYLMRDVNESQTVMMDVNLLNIMYGIAYWRELIDGRPRPLVLYSGYRTPHHNAVTEGAARNSLHKEAKAGDIGMDGIAPVTIAQQAGFFRAGGVGIYQSFTHIDTGRLRFWDGTKRR